MRILMGNLVRLRRDGCLAASLLASLLIALPAHAPKTQPVHKPPGGLFQTSDRCMACHNGFTAPSGEDISIGSDWRPMMMANSGPDPYWLAGVRREIIEHPEARAAIEDECSICHMPMARYQAKALRRDILVAVMPVRAIRGCFCSFERRFFGAEGVKLAKSLSCRGAQGH